VSIAAANNFVFHFSDPQMSEDCLYLNVFTPLSNNSGPLPVMLYIAGGNFQYLGASIPVYEPQHFVNQTNVICVLVQYRLGKTHFTRFDLQIKDIDNKACWVSTQRDQGRMISMVIMVFWINASQ
jgi:carboxylesterase type B